MVFVCLSLLVHKSSSELTGHFIDEKEHHIDVAGLFVDGEMPVDLFTISLLRSCCMQGAAGVLVDAHDHGHVFVAVEFAHAHETLVLHIRSGELLDGGAAG